MAGLPPPDPDELCLGVAGWVPEPAALGFREPARILLTGPDEDAWRDALELAIDRAKGAGAEVVVADGGDPGSGAVIAEALAAGKAVFVPDADLLDAEPSLWPARGRLVAACETERAAGSFRGLLPWLRRARMGVILGAASPTADEVFGVRVRHLLSPAAVARAGEGVIVTRGKPRRFLLAGTGR